MWYSVCTGSLAILTITYLISSHTRNKRQEHHQSLLQRGDGCKPPRIIPNKWWPPFGLDKLALVLQAEGSKTYPLLMLQEHEAKGDTYAQFGGPVFTVLTRDRGNIREVLSRQQKNFDIGSARAGCVAPLLGDGIFTQDGSKWERSRRMLAPLIQRPTLPDLDLIERHFQRLLGKIKRAHAATAAEQTIDLKPFLFDFSLETTTEFLLGNPLDGENAQDQSFWSDSFAREFNTAFAWISKRERLKGFYWMIDGIKFRQACRRARKIVHDAITRSMGRLRERPPREKETHVAMEPLFRNKEGEVQMIRDQFLNLLLAGRDTSGSLLCWTFYALAREPGIVAALQKEMKNILGPGLGREPTKGDLNRMPILDRFITETLRVFPPVPINGRFSNTATTLPHGGGPDGSSPILVPKGTLVAFSTFAVHHDKNVYGPDASEFRIDRWTDDAIKERRMIDWSYFPFLGGPRKCLGERFALVEAKYLVVRMLQYFESIVAVNENGAEETVAKDGAWVDDVKYHVGLTMSPDEGVWVRLKSSS
ncbi:cytochrome P450 CYP5202A1 [Lecanosticta acicola]|uniref:Cytochrome P450 CYP5202A1 n=1 Tax=Lecanosticta acicola TaxID=111012 RepID=A0AAI8Z3K0_9PEZI|nr:cytochrome P450 CYP5202A1 [Lecanosticta acicola]